MGEKKMMSHIIVGSDLSNASKIIIEKQSKYLA